MRPRPFDPRGELLGPRERRRAAPWGPPFVNLPVLRKRLRTVPNLGYLPVQVRMNSVEARVPSAKTAVACACSLPSGHFAERMLSFWPL